jgi:hypothetical protein
MDISEENKTLYNQVVIQLKNKFKPIIKTNIKKDICSCCKKKKQFMRYYLGRTMLCSKSCYKYYYSMDDNVFYRHHNC